MGLIRLLRQNFDMQIRPVRRASLLVVAVAALGCLGCGAAPTRPGLMANLASDEVSVSQLRAIDYEFASRFGQLVAKCAHEILEDGHDPEVHRRALMWQMYASPQARAAAFNQDPMAGLLELWALAGQQAEYFASGDGHSFFKNDHPCVQSTANQLYIEARELAAAVIPEDRFAGIEAHVEAWIAEHPIEGELFVRPTAQAGLAALMGRDIEGGLKAVGNIEETLRDLNDRLAILSVQIPTESRWQAEFLVRELLSDELAGASRSLKDTMGQISTFVQDFDDTLHAQTTRLIDTLSREREAWFESFGVEREIVFAAIDDERASLFEAFNEEVDAAVTRFEEAGYGLIDYFFERLTGVLIWMCVFMLLLVAILALALRPRRQRAGPTDVSAADRAADHPPRPED